MKIVPVQAVFPQQPDDRPRHQGNMGVSTWVAHTIWDDILFKLWSAVGRVSEASACCRPWAHNSAVECHLHTVEVVGSNPAVPTIFKLSRNRHLQAPSRISAEMRVESEYNPIFCASQASLTCHVQGSSLREGTSLCRDLRTEPSNSKNALPGWRA
jgi:hypothetical protein